MLRQKNNLKPIVSNSYWNVKVLQNEKSKMELNVFQGSVGFSVGRKNVESNLSSGRCVDSFRLEVGFQN